jgi:N-acetylmuramoyl-L-alanine amidase
VERIIFNKKLLILFLVTLFINSLFAKNLFVKSKIRKGELRLYFSSDIEGVKYFAIPLDDGSTKYVYDIYGATLPKGKGISHHSYKNIDSFRMAQNNPERVRVVIKSPQKPLNKHVYSKNLLTIPLIYGREATTSNKSVEESETTLDDIDNRAIEEEEEKKRYVIVIDAGHGGKDNGATCCGSRNEKKIVLKVSKKLKVKLEKMGYKVYMTRYKDNFVKLPKRTEFANKKRADVFISVHANAAPNKEKAKIFKGIEVYYLSPAHSKRAKKAAEKENSVMLENKDFYTKNDFLSLLNREKIVESHKLGLDIKRNTLTSLRGHYKSVSDGGVKGANFWVLVGAQMPSVLVEIGYLTHPEEGKNLLKNYYQLLLANGIAKGVKSYLKKNKR